jgi:hypothetical protein
MLIEQVFIPKQIDDNIGQNSAELLHFVEKHSIWCISCNTLCLDHCIIFPSLSQFRSYTKKKLLFSFKHT